ncbi:MAG: glycosyltransferase family 1 protein [bacterium]
MRIGIDARLAFGDSTGLGTFSRRLVDALSRHDSGNEYVLYVDRPTPPVELPENVRVELVPGQSRIAWTNLRLPRVLRRDRIDLYHAVANFELPLAFRGLKVLTVHDLVPLRFPATVPWKHRLFFHLFTRPALAAADRIVAISAHTRDEIVAAYGIPAASIDVVPNWVTEAFHPRQRDTSRETGAPRARSRHGLVDDYFVFVGVREPKKNLDRLLEAFAALGSPRGRRCQLALVGPPGWSTDDLEGRVRSLGIGDRVVFTGRVPEADLIELLQDARALVFPSLSEGFGLPVLEAMACGTAVIAARAGALPEVAGDAALLVDPLAVSDIAAAMARLLEDEELARVLGARGQARAGRWNAAAAAERWVALYLELFNAVP